MLEVLKGEFLTVKGSAQTLKSYLLKLIGALSMYYSKEVEPKVREREGGGGGGGKRGNGMTDT